MISLTCAAAYAQQGNTTQGHHKEHINRRQLPRCHPQTPCLPQPAAQSSDHGRAGLSQAIFATRSPQGPRRPWQSRPFGPQRVVNRRIPNSERAPHSKGCTCTAPCVCLDKSLDPTSCLLSSTQRSASAKQPSARSGAGQARLDLAPVAHRLLDRLDHPPRHLADIARPRVQSGELQQLKHKGDFCKQPLQVSGFPKSTILLSWGFPLKKARLNTQAHPLLITNTH